MKLPDNKLRLCCKYFWNAGQQLYEEKRKISCPSLKLVKAQKFICYAEIAGAGRKNRTGSLHGQAKLDGIFYKIICTKTPYNHIDQRLQRVRNIDFSRKTEVDRIRQNSRKALRNGLRRL